MLPRFQRVFVSAWTRHQLLGSSVVLMNSSVGKSQYLKFCSRTTRFYASLSTANHEVKCENIHITWAKKEFLDMLGHEIEQTSLQTSRDTNRNIYKNIRNDYFQLAAGVERLLALQSTDEVDSIGAKFRAIDPDRIIPLAEVQKSKFNKDGDVSEIDLTKEADFLKHISHYLRQAGFAEVSQNAVRYLFFAHHRYGNVELTVDMDEFDFLRIWVFGKSGSSIKQSITIKSMTEKQWHKFRKPDYYQADTQLCHRRVVIAAKSKSSANMIFKCFKDVPVGHFEPLIPQAKINIPWKQKWFWNIFLVSSGLTFFINIGLWLQSEHKFGGVLVSMIVLGFIANRTRVIYRNVRNRYNILWKQMLYYKSTSNNSALALEIVNRAKGQDFKKTMLAYVAATQAFSRNKGQGVTSEEIIGQCKAWFDKIEHDHPNREVGTIDFSVGVANLLNIGLLTHSDNKLYDVADVPTSLKKVKEELIAQCIEICDSS